MSDQILFVKVANSSVKEFWKAKSDKNQYHRA